jgi:hypothetical protein
MRPLKIRSEDLLGMTARTNRTRVGGASVDRDLKVAKKPYSAPSFQVLDAGAAKAKLEATGTPDDENARQMLSVLNQPLDREPSPAPSISKAPLP